MSWGALRRAPQTPRALRRSESRFARSPYLDVVTVNAVLTGTKPGVFVG